VVIATHSADFLIGCVQSGVPVNIVRLTFDGTHGTARAISPPVLSDLMRDALLRSTGVLAGLFHDGAVVTEAASDSAFYAEINHRLFSAAAGGHDGLLFLSAQNKQTTWRIAKPLRDIGVPTAIVVDLDIIKDGGASWSNLLDSLNVPTAQVSALGQYRGDVLACFTRLGIDPKAPGAVTRLPSADQNAVNNLIAQLAEFGLFVVPPGTLESWLSDLHAVGRKGDWLADIFAKMGSDPASPSFVGPSQGDVWDFVRAIASWVRDPARKGMS